MKIAGKRSFGRDMAITAGLLTGICTLYVIRSTSYEGEETATERMDTPSSLTMETASASDRLSYIQSTFPRISSWNTAEIRSLLAEPTRHSLPNKDLVEVVATLENNLGSLESYSLPVESHLIAMTDESMLVTYEFSALFSKGQADVTLQLLDEGGSIGLLAFNITLVDSVEQLS